MFHWHACLDFVTEHMAVTSIVKNYHKSIENEVEENEIRAFSGAS